jgi:hypothetical protein
MDNDTNYRNYSHPSSSIQTAQVLRCIAQSLLASADELERTYYEPTVPKHSEPSEYDL